MSILWVTKYTKFLVLTMGILMVIGLIVMGNFEPTGSAPYVGKINGKIIGLEEFRFELDQALERQRTQSNRSLEGWELVQLRKNLLENRFHGLLIEDFMNTYKLNASGDEMWFHLENYPDPAFQQDTFFQTNGNFDRQKYLQWIHSEEVLNHAFMQNMEQNLKFSIIPSQQLQILSSAQFHETRLEKAFENYKENIKLQMKFYFLSLDSIDPVPAVTENEVWEYFKANPDSFYVKVPAVELGYIKFDLTPSAQDTTATREFALELKSRMAEGETFEELAVSYSEDVATAENGGSMGGLQKGENWDPAILAAAFALDSSQVSEPILTTQGIHLIKSNGKKEEEGELLVDISQILIKIQITPETVDSVSAKAEKIVTEAENKFLKDLAVEKGIPYIYSAMILKGNYFPLGRQEYLSGVHSFAFSPAEKNQKYSEVLQSETGIYVFERVREFSEGRHFERDSSEIRENLQKRKKLSQAKTNLEKKFLSSPGDPLPSRLGKAMLDSTEMISPKTWIAGIGYDAPALYHVLHQEKGKWGEVRESEFGVFSAMVLNKEIPEITQLIQANQANSEIEVGSVQKFYTKWFELVKENAEIEENLDLIFRN